MDEKQKLSPGVSESLSHEIYEVPANAICYMPARSSPMAPEPRVLHGMPREAICHRPPAPRGPDFPRPHEELHRRSPDGVCRYPGPLPSCPCPPEPQKELLYISPETVCHLPAAPRHVAPPTKMTLIQLENKDEEQPRLHFPKPGPLCRLPPPDPGPMCPLNPSPVLLKATTSEQKDLEAEVESTGINQL
ncbi:hypothetical protein EXN66_Car021121 [Channa argus]|uniref:Uncharacterized protein n=1 Tax=Channa argus TaxID=215402 RepID=A0A6G1QRT4_CHAAH|nr:hypothetical protein EXN66_Car021121 [Channa argus]